MPMSVRLDADSEHLLAKTAAALKTSKAQVIKKSLADYCTRVLAESRERPYDLIKDLLGKHGSDRGDLAIRSEEILRERFRGKK